MSPPTDPTSERPICEHGSYFAHTDDDFLSGARIECPGPCRCGHKPVDHDQGDGGCLIGHCRCDAVMAAGEVNHAD